MPMSPRLLRPRVGVSASHPEVRDWALRVVANGGRASATTIAAMDTFASRIDAESGLRAAILRLNLFCGNSLNAALVPLYRSSSFGGSVVGGATDANFNFVNADFAADGSSGGLTGNGSTKYLDTGFTPADWSSRTSIHLSFSGTGLATSGNSVTIGAISNADQQGTLYALDAYASYVSARAARLSNYTATPLQFPTVSSPGASESHFIGTRTAATAAVIYRGGTSAASNATSVTPSSHTRPLYVFALNSVGTANTFSAARLRMYSIGNGLTAAQALAFSNAVAEFNTALGR